MLSPFLIFKLLAQFLCVLQNYLAPGNLSNLSFLAGPEQLICRTLNLNSTPLAASDPLVTRLFRSVIVYQMMKNNVFVIFLFKSNINSYKMTTQCSHFRIHL